MKIKLLSLVIVVYFLLSGFVHASVCSWVNRKDQPFETYDYTWGGGPFSTFEECQTVIRVTIMAVAPYFKDFGGELSFLDPTTQTVSTCYLEALKIPFDEAPPGYDELVLKAFNGKSNPQEFLPYRDYINSQFTGYCQ